MKAMSRLALVAASVALVAGACAGGPLPGEAVAQAASLAEDQGSAKVFMEVSNTFGGQEFVVSGDGELDFVGKAGHLTLTPQGSGPAAQLGSIEAVFSEFVAYLRMDAFQQYLPPGKEWVKIDFEAVSEDAGIDFSQLSQLGQNDPAQQLNYLRGVADVEEVGSEDVRGTETTHYKGVLDFKKVAREFPEAAESLRQLEELSGITSAPLEVWIDGEGLPRRVSYAFELNAPGGDSSQSATSAILIEYFDYGTEVNVEIPSEDLVVDPSKLKA